MAVIDDLEVFPELSPRLVLLGSALSSATVQDIHDTLCAWQDSTDGHPFDVIVESAGKEALGGGVTVGITTTLQNAKIGFQAHKVWKASGTVSMPDVTGVTLNDAGATFITDGVEPGSWIVNLDDGSIATVLRVDSETQLTTDTLGGGADNEWGPGDDYRIMEVLQKNIDGGNLVAVDELQAEIDPIFSTAGNQVLRTLSSSATLQELTDIQYSSQFVEYPGAVVIDTINGSAGTQYPRGTLRDPVSNLADAKVIAATYGLSKFNIVGVFILAPTDNVDGLTIVGQNSMADTVVMLAGCSTVNTAFRDLRLTGVFGGGVLVEKCSMSSCSNIGSDTESSLFNECILIESTFGFAAGLVTPQKMQFVNCVSGVQSAGGVVIDHNGSAIDSAFRKYSGAVTLVNHSGAANSVWEFDNGSITLEASCTAGHVQIRGHVDIVDNSAGTIVDANGSALTATQSLQLQSLFKAMALDPADKWITTPTEMRTASGDIVIKLTGDGVTYTEGERQ
jgi:hypothetical protein